MKPPDQPIDPDRWVDDHGDVLYAYAVLRLRDADTASEVVQETFLEALKGRSKFQGRSSERTWLIGILKHKIIDQFRRKARRELGVGGEERPDLDPGDFFNERGEWKVRIERWVEPPEAATERAEFWEVFRACLAELPPSYADAFTLSELEQLPGSEVCKILEITPTNLWARFAPGAAHTPEVARRAMVRPRPRLRLKAEPEGSVFVDLPNMLYPYRMARYEVVWRILALHCDEASRLSSESLDHALPTSDKFAWKLHLLICTSCRRYRRQILSLREISRKAAEPVPGPESRLADEARDRLKRSLREGSP